LASSEFGSGESISEAMSGKLIESSREWTTYHPRPVYNTERNLAHERMLNTHRLRVILQNWSFVLPMVKKPDIPESLVHCQVGANEYGTDPRAHSWL
jgi:hypothetical protein